MSNINIPAVSVCGSGSTTAQGHIAKGNTAVSSKGAQCVIPANLPDPMVVLETPDGAIRVDW